MALPSPCSQQDEVLNHLYLSILHTKRNMEGPFLTMKMVGPSYSFICPLLTLFTPGVQIPKECDKLTIKNHQLHWVNFSSKNTSPPSPPNYKSFQLQISQVLTPKWNKQQIHGSSSYTKTSMQTMNNLSVQKNNNKSNCGTIQLDPIS